MKINNDGYLVETDNVVPQGIAKTVVFTFQRYGFWGSLGRYIMMKADTKRYMDKGKTSAERKFRKNLMRKFAVIQNRVACAHSPFQFVLMADYILNLKIEGPIVQCGSFKGGSTAKLSLIAEKTGRKLIVCDSFEGLPEPKEKDELHLRGNDGIPDYSFRPGEYKGAMEEVKENVGKYGSVGVCEFVRGYFEDTLPKLDVKPAVVFIDVDFISSARDCLKNLWPKLLPGGLWFTHEAGFMHYMKGIMDKKWWKENLKDCPPLVIGAGSGLSSAAPSIAYFQKEL